MVGALSNNWGHITLPDEGVTHPWCTGLSEIAKQIDDWRVRCLPTTGRNAPTVFVYPLLCKGSSRPLMAAVADFLGRLGCGTLRYEFVHLQYHSSTTAAEPVTPTVLTDGPYPVIPCGGRVEVQRDRNLKWNRALFDMTGALECRVVEPLEEDKLYIMGWDEETFEFSVTAHNRMRGPATHIVQLDTLKSLRVVGRCHRTQQGSPCDG